MNALMISLAAATYDRTTGMPQAADGRFTRSINWRRIRWTLFSSRPSPMNRRFMPTFGNGEGTGTIAVLGEPVRIAQP